MTVQSEFTQAQAPMATASGHDGKVRVEFWPGERAVPGGPVIVWLTLGQATTLAGHLALAAGDELRRALR